ncbi:unnamed protein product [Moneuplotes crassus]|uniref:Uncharacterized protein n=1 Tax=Euplotes crassus TaxID=5936 RepID=A0AAD1U8K7_EUPCR|nr:unnamed protein product [Moneuplotes crassus]
MQVCTTFCKHNIDVFLAKNQMSHFSLEGSEKNSVDGRSSINPSSHAFQQNSVRKISRKQKLFSGFVTSKNLKKSTNGIDKRLKYLNKNKTPKMDQSAKTPVGMKKSSKMKKHLKDLINKTQEDADFQLPRHETEPVRDLAQRPFTKSLTNREISSMKEIKKTSSKTQGKVPNRLKPSNADIFNELADKHPTIDISAIQEIGKGLGVDQTAYEKEILNCMLLAKEKVKRLAGKLQDAKDYISKLRSSLDNANQIISEYSDANTSLITRIKDLEGQIELINTEKLQKAKLLSTQEIKKMIEESLSEADSEASFRSSQDLEVANVRKQLRGLKSEVKFKYFLKINDLDPVKILSMPNADPMQKAGMENLSFDSLNDSSIEPIELTLEDYAKFSYLICRLLELEEKYRLKTEEQYNAILEQQMDRCKVVEMRENEIRKKFSKLSQKLFTDLEISQ